MATITKTIGTASRDYSTITLWEADLDNGGIYAAGDDAVGVCYNDSTFDEQVYVDGGGTIDLNTLKLTVATGNRHDGTAGTGAWLNANNGGSGYTGFPVAFRHVNAGPAMTLEWLEISAKGQTFGGSCKGLMLERGLDTVANVLIHTLINTADGGTRQQIHFLGDSLKILNVMCFIGGGNGAGAEWNGQGGFGHEIYNCSISSDCSGFCSFAGSGYYTNCVGPAFGASGTTIEYCASFDSSATGTGSLTNLDPADQYVSTVTGSEDLHLLSTADCVDAGTDLGISPAGVNIDIDGRDRDAEGDVWDIGADEFVPILAAYVPLFILTSNTPLFNMR